MKNLCYLVSVFWEAVVNGDIEILKAVAEIVGNITLASALIAAVLYQTRQYVYVRDLLILEMRNRYQVSESREAGEDKPKIILPNSYRSPVTPSPQ